MSRGNDTVRILSKLGGRHICEGCADTFIAILDQVRGGSVPAPRAGDDAANDAGDDSGRSS